MAAISEEGKILFRVRRETLSTKNTEQILQTIVESAEIADNSEVNCVVYARGVKEVKEPGNNFPDSTQIVKQEATRLIFETKQFLIMLEEFASDASSENFLQSEKKVNEINMAIERLKSSV